MTRSEASALVTALTVTSSNDEFGAVLVFCKFRYLAVLRIATQPARRRKNRRCIYCKHLSSFGEIDSKNLRYLTALGIHDHVSSVP